MRHTGERMLIVISQVAQMSGALDLYLAPESKALFFEP